MPLSGIRSPFGTFAWQTPSPAEVMSLHHWPAAHWLSVAHLVTQVPTVPLPVILQKVPAWVAEPLVQLASFVQSPQLPFALQYGFEVVGQALVPVTPLSLPHATQLLPAPHTGVVPVHADADAEVHWTHVPPVAAEQTCERQTVAWSPVLHVPLLFG